MFIYSVDYRTHGNEDGMYYERTETELITAQTFMPNAARGLVFYNERSQPIRFIADVISVTVDTNLSPPLEEEPVQELFAFETLEEAKAA